jgi:amino acid permease
MSSETHEGALRAEPLTFWEGVSIIVGCNLGAGILSLAYASRKAGWPVLVTCLIVAGICTTISMLYLAEVTFRTKKPLQLSGLAEKYLGNLGSWAIFIAVTINALGCLIAYTTGSGEILCDLFGIPPLLGSLLFFIPAVGVIWVGLKCIGTAEKYILAGMFVLLGLLIVATFIGPGINIEYITFYNIYYSIPVFSMTIFCYVSQYCVPELARGFVASGNAKKLPAAITTGMVTTGLILAIVPAVALGLSGPDNISEIATISWGKALGQWAAFVANGFALCSMLTSFWAIGGTYFTNIIDKLKFPSESDPKYRTIAIIIMAVPPFLLAYSKFGSFVNALYFAGAYAGAIMSILPVLMLKKARKFGDKEPEWTSGALAHPIIQSIIIILYCGGAVYATLSLMNILPQGW